MSLSKEAPTSFQIERVVHSRVHEVDLATVPFSSVFSDHMFCAEFDSGHWTEGAIRPYGPIPLTPSISALQYGISVFEGLKAHKSPDQRPLLFRPRENARRFQRSAARLAMPAVPEALFIDALHELVRLDEAWIPPADNGALYIRPILFSVDPSVRVKPAERYQFIIFTFPFAAYFPPAVDVMVCESHARAFPGGTGDIKPAGNYAAGLLADLQARKAGFDSVLWLDGMEHRYVEECGVMNVFFVMGKEVVTPPLGGTILPGITRDSVITLLRDMGYAVKETRVSMDDLLESYQRGLLRECFGTGTAATVSSIRNICYKDQTLKLPISADNVAARVKQRLVALMTGREPDPYGWVESIR